MELEHYFKGKKVYVWKETFAIVKSNKYMPEAFANIRDKNEVTVVIDQTKIKYHSVIEVKKDWKMLTFGTILPFELVGFLAKILKILADEKISIFVISAYSTDHILVKEKHLKKALTKFEDLGCLIERK